MSISVATKRRRRSNDIRQANQSRPVATEHPRGLAGVGVGGVAGIVGLVEREGSRSSIPHVSALDGLRGVAVAGVLVFHGGHLLGGYLGVDLFFTLSGFLITTLLLTEATHTGSIRLGGLLARRAPRILPPRA